jgi:hypothetical protein
MVVGYENQTPIEKVGGTPCQSWIQHERVAFTAQLGCLPSYISEGIAMTDQYEERECVRRLISTRGLPAAELLSQDPPRPDVLAISTDGSREAFEVTEVHPDEVPGHGSALRAAEERSARRDLRASPPIWILTDAISSIRLRVEKKVKKAARYEVKPNETLSLLLVGSIPKIGAIAATTVMEAFVKVDRLNLELHEVLGRSRFHRAYLHLPLAGNALWGWGPSSPWRVLRDADDISRDGREILGLIGAQGGFLPNGLLPGTKIMGR